MLLQRNKGGNVSSPPAISVVMSVYNGADYVEKAIKSILSQDFTDFEIIIVDDGSTDHTLAILTQYGQTDSRIKVISQKNTGLTTALNNGIEQAAGRYIARQDADDISLPDRFQKQFHFMEKNKDIVVCGANCINIYTDGLRSFWGWEDKHTLARTVHYKTPFAHSTAFIRKSTLDAAGGYNEKYITAQDTELWLRISKYGNIAMLKDPLVERHILPESISLKRRWRQFYDAFRARWEHSDKKFQIVYYSLRNLLISFLPENIIKLAKNKHS